MTPKTSKANAPAVFHDLLGRLIDAELRAFNIVNTLANTRRRLQDYSDGDTGVSLEITEGCLAEAERLLNEPR